MLELFGWHGVRNFQFSWAWIVHMPSNLEFCVRVDTTTKPLIILEVPRLFPKNSSPQKMGSSNPSSCDLHWESILKLFQPSNIFLGSWLPRLERNFLPWSSKILTLGYRLPLDSELTCLSPLREVSGSRSKKPNLVTAHFFFWDIII